MIFWKEWETRLKRYPWPLLIISKDFSLKLIYFMTTTTSEQRLIRTVETLPARSRATLLLLGSQKVAIWVHLQDRVNTKISLESGIRSLILEWEITSSNIITSMNTHPLWSPRTLIQVFWLFEDSRGQLTSCPTSIRKRLLWETEGKKQVLEWECMHVNKRRQIKSRIRLEACLKTNSDG